MSLRQKFEFAYPVAKLVPLCENSMKYHRSREAWYTQECTAAERDLLENGILKTCGQNELYSGGTISGCAGQYHVSSGLPYAPISTNVRPVIDEKKVNRVNACKAKMFEHANKAGEFERYAHMFKAALCVNSEKTILLDAEDVKFFRIGTEEVPAVEKKRRSALK